MPDTNLRQQAVVAAFLLPLICAMLEEGGVPEAPGRPLSLAFTSRSVNLSWAPPFNADQIGIERYLVQVRRGEDTTWDDSLEAVYTVETPNNETLFQVGSLNPFTTYSFRVVAVTRHGLKSKPSESSFYMFTLREVPSGKPTITAAHNTSSTSIQLIWRPPPKSSINGEFLGYQISYRPRSENASAQSTTVITLKDPEVNSYSIQDLTAFTQYLVSLRIMNPAGLGPETKVVVMTGEGVPSQPMKVVFKEVTNSSVAVHWQQPTTPNGLVAGYRIYYMSGNYTDVMTVRSTNPSMFYVLRGLRSYQRYKIWVKAFTFKNEGESSQPIEVLTDVTGPGAPLFRNVSCVNDNTLSLEWAMPIQFDRSVDYFVIQYRKSSNNQHLFSSMRTSEKVVAGGSSSEIFAETIIVNDVMQANSRLFEYSLSNLTTEAIYEIRIAGATKSIYRKNLVYRGQFSPVRSMLLASKCIYYHTESAIGDPSSADLNDREVASDYREQQVGILIGLTATLGCIFLIALALLVWRRCFGEAYYFLAESPSSLACTAANGSSVAANNSNNGCANNTPDVANTGHHGMTERHPGVPIHLFTRHVLERHANDNQGFVQAFEHIQSLQASPRKNLASLLPHNVDRNRYKNVLAYDHSRVRLQCTGLEHEDYINANFIDGFHRPHAYIATQGPLPSTFADFWLMVWEQNTHVIVMITNFIEGGKLKCDQYWPNKGLLAIYGRIQVALVCQDVQESYTLRVLRLKCLRLEGDNLVDDEDCPERDVLHFHYTAWPDHGTPDTAGQLLAFIQKSSQSNRDTDGPLVVHCSAGVGRTGAYIVIDAMLRQMLAIGKLDIDGYLSYIRGQRNFLIQTLEQFIFVHDVLLEAVSRRMVVSPQTLPPELFSPTSAVAAASSSSMMMVPSVTSTTIASTSMATLSPSSSITMSQGTSAH